MISVNGWVKLAMFLGAGKNNYISKQPQTHTL